MIYKKTDMVYNDYRWSAAADADNPHITGGNDHTELNCTEGYEMIYFINSVATAGKLDVESCQWLEKAIWEKVPANVRTRKGILEWIDSNGLVL